MSYGVHGRLRAAEGRRFDLDNDIAIVLDWARVSNSRPRLTDCFHGGRWNINWKGRWHYS